MVVAKNDSGGKARDVADLHGQRQSIFYKHLDEAIDAILATEWSTMRLPVYPWQRQQLEALKARCATGNYAPYVRGVFGFIDGVVIPTTKPKVSDVGGHVRDFKRSLQSSLPLTFDSASIKSLSCCALFIARSLGSTWC